MLVSPNSPCSKVLKFMPTLTSAKFCLHIHFKHPRTASPTCHPPKILFRLQSHSSYPHIQQNSTPSLPNVPTYYIRYVTPSPAPYRLRPRVFSAPLGRLRIKHDGKTEIDTLSKMKLRVSH
jgi:hypothetical protein